MRVRALVVLIGFAALTDAPGREEMEASGTRRVTEDVLEFQAGEEASRVGREELERLLDGLVGYAMEEHHLPGVAVSVVRSDGLVLAKGWGRARIGPDVPIDPNRTLFRVGSISKTFTFTGVMQQVEAGRLDLDGDISAYLEGVEIPGNERFGPLTMTHLMTHTGGFEATNIGHGATASLEGDHSLTEYVTRYRPARVRPPGELVSYSNQGVSLAGKVLQDVSGEDFAAYMERHVLEPLAMTHSTFRDWPGERVEGYMDPDLAADRAIAYQWSGGRYRPYDRLFFHRGRYPPASLSSTATDMARFMRAHLNGGAVEGSRILATETTADMHRVLFRNADGVMGNAHGFWSGRIAGFRTIEHGGHVLGFYSNMVLVPELDLGIFVATNGDDGRGLVTRLPRRVLQSLFPDRTELPEPDPGLVERAGTYTGSYLGTRRGYTTLDKLIGMMRFTAQVSVADSGHLVVTGLGEARRYVPANDRLFLNVTGGRSIAFELADGKAIRFFTATQAFERIGFWQTAGAFRLVTLGGGVVFLAVLIGFWLRRGRRLEQTGMERWSSRLLGATAALWLVSVGALIVRMASQGGPEPMAMADFPDLLAAVALWGILVSVVLTGLCLLGLVPVWLYRSWGLSRVLRHTGVVAVMVTMTLMLWQWNAIGVQIAGA